MNNIFEQHIDCWGGYFRKIAPQFAAPWDAIHSIQQMHNENNSTLQTEWQGWFTEHKLEHHSANHIEEFKIHSRIPDPEDRILDGFYENLGMKFPIDVKTTSGHKINSRGKLTYNPGTIILNDEDTTNKVLDKYGATGVMLVSGLATIEDPSLREVKEFLKQLRLARDGVEESKYSKENTKAGKKSTLLKREFRPLRIEIYLWDKEDFKRHSSTGKIVALNQPGSNSNGKPRPKKYNMKASELSPLVSMDLLGNGQLKISHNVEYYTTII